MILATFVLSMFTTRLAWIGTTRYIYRTRKSSIFLLECIERLIHVLITTFIFQSRMAQWVEKKKLFYSENSVRGVVRVRETVVPIHANHVLNDGTVIVWKIINKKKKKNGNGSFGIVIKLANSKFERTSPY